MTEAIRIAAKRRELTGKANRRLAGESLVPAVLYGDGVAATSIALDRHDIELEISQGGGPSALYKLALDDDAPVNVVIRGLQRHPTKGSILHLDFLAVAADKPVAVYVPLHVIGNAEGVKAGGILTVDAHEIHIEAKPADIPEAIDADVSGLEIGSALSIGDLGAPAGVTILDDPEKIVCSVVAPAVEVEGATEAGLEAGEVPEVGEEAAAPAEEE